MTPEYLRELADKADPDQLWKLGWEEREALPVEKRMQLDTAVALRRYAHNEQRLLEVLKTKRSWLITPFSANHTAQMEVDTPAEHEELRPQPLQLVAGTGPDEDCPF